MSTATSLRIKRGDRLPALVLQLTEAGVPFDPTGYTFQLRGRNAAGAVVIDAPLVVLDPATCKLSYAWAEADTAAPGGLDLEVVATRTTDLLQRTFPDEGFLSVTITEDL